MREFDNHVGVANKRESRMAVVGPKANIVAHIADNQMKLGRRKEATHGERPLCHLDTNNNSNEFIGPLNAKPNTRVGCHVDFDIR